MLLSTQFSNITLTYVGILAIDWYQFLNDQWRNTVLWCTVNQMCLSENIVINYFCWRSNCFICSLVWVVVFMFHSSLLSELVGWIPDNIYWFYFFFKKSKFPWIFHYYQLNSFENTTSLLKTSFKYYYRNFTFLAVFLWLVMRMLQSYHALNVSFIQTVP